MLLANILAAGLPQSIVDVAQNSIDAIRSLSPTEQDLVIQSCKCLINVDHGKSRF